MRRNSARWSRPTSSTGSSVSWQVKLGGSKECRKEIKILYRVAWRSLVVCLAKRGKS